MKERKNTRGAVIAVALVIVILIVIIVWRTRMVRQGEESPGSVPAEIEQKY